MKIPSLNTSLKYRIGLNVLRYFQILNVDGILATTSRWIVPFKEYFWFKSVYSGKIFRLPVCPMWPQSATNCPGSEYTESRTLRSLVRGLECPVKHTDKQLLCHQHKTNTFLRSRQMCSTAPLWRQRRGRLKGTEWLKLKLLWPEKSNCIYIAQDHNHIILSGLNNLYRD